MLVGNRVRYRRRGFSYLEVQTAFAVLGVALAGLAPVVMAQLRLMSRIESRLPSNRVNYLVPPSRPWAAKLGVAATRTTAAPESPAPAVPTEAVNVVTIKSCETSSADDTARIVVSAVPLAPPGE